VSFFEPPPPPELPEEVHERKPWWGAPTNELGVSTGLRVLLVRTDDVAVSVIDAVAFKSGVQLKLVAARRRPSLADPFELHHQFAHRMQAGGDLPPELLRFGVEFSDGRKATSLGSGPAASFSLHSDEGSEPQGPLLLPGGGGGDDARWESEFWLWPLPPPGPLAVVIEWPAEGIELTREEVDSAPIIEAASRSEVLWPELQGDGGSWTSFGV